MFARMIEFFPRIEMKEELLKTIRKEVLPILKKEHGFLEILPLIPDVKTEKIIGITLWNEKRDAERYERETYAKVEEILKPYMVAPVTIRHYTVETALCEHFVEALAA